MEKNIELESKTKDLVVNFVNALTNNDLQKARNCVSDDFTYTSPLGSYDRPEPYFKRMEQTPLKFDIKKVFVDGNEVCVIVDVIAGPMALFSCGWYVVENQKIRSLKLAYDPRSIIEAMAKK